jgi:hypothetical protein
VYRDSYHGYPERHLDLHPVRPQVLELPVQPP